jgi:putative membrane protein
VLAPHVDKKDSILLNLNFVCGRGVSGAGQAPPARPENLRLIKRLLHGEMLAIVIILLCAAIMARGGWV